MSVVDVLLVTLAVVGGGSDLATRRIPNWLTFPAMAAGVAWNSYAGSWWGALLSAAGLLLGAAVFLPFFLLGGTGAGDVKMMAAAGAIAGPQGFLVIFMYTGLLGGAMALLVAAAHGAVGRSVANAGRLVGRLLRGEWRQAAEAQTASVVPRLRYGAAIASGCLLFSWWGPKSL
jgi:prepilin peptidase CpaA